MRAAPAPFRHPRAGAAGLFRDAPVRRKEGHVVHLRRKHADGSGEKFQQVHRHHGLLVEAARQKELVHRDDLGFLQRRGGRHPRQAVEKRGFPENIVLFQNGQRLFQPVFRADENPHAAAFQIIKVIGSFPLAVDHPVLRVKLRRFQLFQDAPGILFGGDADVRVKNRPIQKYPTEYSCFVRKQSDVEQSAHWFPAEGCLWERA